MVKWHPLRALREIGVKEARDLPWNFGPRDAPVDLRKQSKYARSMNTLSARIFSEVDPPTSSANRAVVEHFSKLPFELDEPRVRYYPPQPMLFFLSRVLRLTGVYRDEHLDFKEEMARYRALGGKVVPKPGEGKRSQLRKQGLTTK